MNLNAHLILVASFLSFTAHAVEQSWNPVEGSSLWDLTTPNWDTGAVWGVADGSLTNTAVFGASSCKNVTVEGDVPFGGATFTEDGYTIGGTGTLWLPNNSTTSPQVSVVTVAENCTATFAARVDYLLDSFFNKAGPGTLVLTNELRTLRVRSHQGAMKVISNDVYTAKFEVLDPVGDPTLYLDGANIHVKYSNNRVFFGDAGCFGKAEIGPGGVTFTMDNDGVIKQSLRTAEGLGKDGGIHKEGAGVLRLFSDNDFNGGLWIEMNQVRFKEQASLGTGPISVKKGNLLLDTSGHRVDVTNKISVTSDSYVGTVGNAGDELALHNIGCLTDQNQNKRQHFPIGRKEGYSAVRLVLDDPASEALGRFDLRGGLDLTVDGGTLTAAYSVETQYFHTAGLDATNPPVVKVDKGGFRFDSNGYGTELGVTLALREGVCETNYSEIAGAFANPGFEENDAGWTLGNTKYSGGGRYNNESAFVQNNSNVVAEKYKTPDGNWFMVIRQMASLSSAFTVPEDGDWVVSFLLGCRPRTDYAGRLVSVTVRIDAGTDAEKTFVIGQRESSHPFRRFQTDAYPLAKGVHTLRIETDDGHASQSFESLLLDDFQLMKPEVTIHTNPPIVKLGDGLLMIANQRSDGLVAVSNGTLRLQEYALNGATVEVNAGAQLDLDAGILTNAAVRVAAGGTLSLRGARNLIPFSDADFEGFDMDSAKETKGTGYYELGRVHEWTFTKLNEQTATSGAQRNGGTLSEKSGSFLTKSGSNTLFLRSDTCVSRTVDVQEAGTYRVSLLHAARIYGDSYETPFSISVDGTNVCEVAARTAYEDFKCACGQIDLEAGEHTLSIQAGGGKKSGRLLFLDDIRFERVDAAQMAIVDTRIDLVSGAILDLQNAAPIYLPGNVYIDDEPFTGGRSRLERRGVVVKGDGLIQVGPADGTVLLLR